MLGRVWLLGSRRICPFSLPAAVARRPGRAQLGSVGLTGISPLCTDPSEDLALPLCSQGQGGHLRTATQPEASRHCAGKFNLQLQERAVESLDA